MSSNINSDLFKIKIFGILREKYCSLTKVIAERLPRNG